MKGKWYWMFFGGVVAILLLPLLNIPPLFSPPAWGQVVAFRVLFGLLFLLLLWQLIEQRKLSLLIPHGKAKLPWALLYVFGAVLLATTAFSIDPMRSFWDDPGRAWGTLTYLFYIAFAVSLFLVLKEKEWRKLWYVLLGTGVGLSLLAAFQNFGLFSDTLISYGRPVATLGNPLFLAMTLIPLTIMGFVWFMQQHTTKRRLLIAAALFLFLYAIFITASRSAFLGLGAGIIFFLLFAPKSKGRFAKTAMFAIILAGSLLVWYASANPTMPEFLQPVPNAKTLWSRLSLAQGFKDARFPVWNIAGEAALQRPVFGYGPYNASIALDQFYDPTIGPINTSIGWWDTSHNIFVDLFVETGMVGLAAFLLFLAALFWKLQQAGKNPMLRLRVIGVQAAFLGYFVSALFAFNTFATYLVFFFLLAYSFFLISQGQKEQEKEFNPSKIRGSFVPKVAFGLLTLFMAWFLWQHNIAPLWVNKEMNVATFQAQNGRCQQALQKAEAQSSPSPSLDYYLPAQYTNIIRACLPSGAKDPEARVLLSLKASQLLDKAASARPHYSRTYLTKADYLNIAFSYLADGEQKESLAKEAEAALQKAEELSPEREDLYKKWARAARLRGNYEETIILANQCLALNDTITFSDCLWERALANMQLGNVETADKDLAELIERRYVPSLRVTQLATIYRDRNDYERLENFYEQVVAITANPQHAASLALLQKELGNWDKAHEAALLILDWEPGLREQIEEFLVLVRNALQQECKTSPSSCWRLSLVELTLGNEQGAALAKTKAEQLGFPTFSKEALKDLVEIYRTNQDIPRLIETYQQRAELAEQQGQYESAQNYEEYAKELQNQLSQ